MREFTDCTWTSKDIPRAPPALKSIRNKKLTMYSHQGNWQVKWEKKKLVKKKKVSPWMETTYAHKSQYLIFPCARMHVHVHVHTIFTTNKTFSYEMLKKRLIRTNMKDTRSHWERIIEDKERCIKFSILSRWWKCP